jgi:hypothetical protein
VTLKGFDTADLQEAKTLLYARPKQADHAC